MRHCPSNRSRIGPGTAFVLSTRSQSSPLVSHPPRLVCADRTCAPTFPVPRFWFPISRLVVALCTHGPRPCSAISYLALHGRPSCDQEGSGVFFFRWKMSVAILRTAVMCRPHGLMPISSQFLFGHSVVSSIYLGLRLVAFSFCIVPGIHTILRHAIIHRPAHHTVFFLFTMVTAASRR